MVDASLPPVSIVIPERNEKAYIGRCLAAVLCQDYPAGLLEVFVVDGLSTDGTPEIVQAFRRDHPELDLRLVDNPGRIVPAAMNTVLPLCAGEMIVRVDGHCEIAPDYIRRCVELLREGIAEGVGGPMQTIGETPLSETIAVAMSSIFGVGGSAFRTIQGRTLYADTIPFPAYRRDVIARAGAYDEELVRNQDDEYNYRIRAGGGRLLLAADIRSRYYSRGSLGRLWRQYFQYGFYKVRVLQKHPHQMSLRQFVPPVFVAGLLAALAAALIVSWGWILLAVVSALYLAANLAASLLTAARRGWRHLAVLPLAFSVLHFSYGLGFLAGLARFWNRWGDRVGKTPHLKDFHASIQ